MNAPEKLAIIGTRRPRKDGREKVSGRSIFTDDIELPGMLYGRILRSPHPKARIKKLDLSRAAKLPGVKAIITADNISAIVADPDLSLFTQHTASYIGEEIAAVAAIDELTAQEAIELIEVEYEILPAVTTMLKAMKPNAPMVDPQTPGNLAADFDQDFGELDAATISATHTFSDKFKTSPSHNVLSELHVVVADFSNAEKLTVWSPLQSPKYFQSLLASTFGLKASQVQLIFQNVGGAFSGRAMPKNHHNIAAVLSRKTGRPVKIRAVADEEFTIFPANGECHFTYETTVTDDGTIETLDIGSVLEAGAGGGGHHFKHTLISVYPEWLYKFKGMRYNGKAVLTNAIPTENHHGGIMGHLGAGLMQHLARVAEELKIDPIDFHIKNAVEKDHTTHTGQVFRSCGMRECLEIVSDRSGWKDKYGKLPPFHGIGVGIGSQVSGFKWPGRSDTSAVVIMIHAAGAATVLTGIPDIGQGSHTTMAMIAGECLGLPLSDISIKSGDTDGSPEDPGAFGQRGTFVTGNAVIRACEDAKQQLAERAAEKLNAKPEELVFKDRQIQVKDAPSRSVDFAKMVDEVLNSPEGRSIIGRGFYNPPIEKGSAAYSFGAQVAEVVIEPDTGTVKVTKVTVAHDVGRAMNPLAIEGQLDGQVFSGLSQVLFEECITADGQVMNPSRLEYKTPRTYELPEVDYTLVETMDPYGPFGAKEVGEGPIEATFGAVSCAVANALNGVMPQMPFTPWRVMQAIKQRKMSIERSGNSFRSK